MTVSLQFTRRTPCSQYMGRPIRFYENVIQVYILLSTTSARVSAPIVGSWVASRLGRGAEQGVEVKIPVSRIRADSPGRADVTSVVYARQHHPQAARFQPNNVARFKRLHHIRSSQIDSSDRRASASTERSAKASF